MNHLDVALQAADGCSHSQQLTSDWLQAAGIDLRVLDKLRHAGGGCDCETLANLDYGGRGTCTNNG
ncbi:DUF2695 domain-containing protein [Micromonospora sp. NPDC050276]|uniref:DUF2695 domain-containing protein n=1 Tax=Micromonospora sp. NPDC050276 TaxID=3364278 RepID=UPI0037A80E80